MTHETIRNNIKVTAEYIKPSTAVFDKYFNEFYEWQTIADDDEKYYTPLSDLAEEQKMIAILEQLETITDCLKKIVAIGGWGGVIIPQYFDGGYIQRFEMNYNAKTNEFEILWNEKPFTIEQLRETRDHFNADFDDTQNILGCWEEWAMYEQLEEICIKKIEELTYYERVRSRKRISRFENITNE